MNEDDVTIARSISRADQHSAALREVRSIIDRLGLMVEGSVIVLRPIGPLRRELNVWTRAALVGGTCEHLGDSPAPAAGLLGWPGEIYCGADQCRERITMGWESQPIRCNACHRQRPHLKGVWLQSGVIAVSGVVCNRCVRASRRSS